jgi:hypothetical protein
VTFSKTNNFLTNVSVLTKDYDSGVGWPDRSQETAHGSPRSDTSA